MPAFQCSALTKHRAPWRRLRPSTKWPDRRPALPSLAQPDQGPRKMQKWRSQLIEPQARGYRSRQDLYGLKAWEKAIVETHRFRLNEPASTDNLSATRVIPLLLIRTKNKTDSLVISTKRFSKQSFH